MQAMLHWMQAIVQAITRNYIPNPEQHVREIMFW